QLLAADLDQADVAEAARLVHLGRQQLRAAGARSYQPDEPVAVAVEGGYQAFEIRAAHADTGRRRLLGLRHRDAALLEPEERAPERLPDRATGLVARAAREDTGRSGPADLTERLHHRGRLRTVQQRLDTILGGFVRRGVELQAETSQRGQRRVAARA